MYNKYQIIEEVRDEIIGGVKKLRDSLEDLLEKTDMLYTCLCSDYSKGNEVSELNTFYGQYILAFVGMSRIVRMFSAFSSRSRKEMETRNDILEKCKYVKAYNLNGNLVVYLPYVPAKFFRQSYLFAQEVQELLMELNYRGCLPKMTEKNISVIHVFKSDVNTVLMPDNDNYDMKAITDCIVNCVGGGDAALSCSFMYDTVIDDELDEGSYIYVSPKKQFKLTNEIISEIKKGVE